MDAIIVSSRRRLRQYVSIATITVVIIATWGFVYRWMNDLDVFQYDSTHFVLRIFTFALSLLTVGYVHPRAIHYNRLASALCFMMVMVLAVIQIALFTYPNPILSSTPIACYVLVHIVVFSYTTEFSVLEHSVMWIGHAIVGYACINVIGTPLEFVHTNLMTSVLAVGVSALMGWYDQISARLSWQRITIATEQMLNDRKEMAMMLDELLPGDVLVALNSLDVNRWHEISRSYESAAVIFCSIKNLPELVQNLDHGDLVVVLHTVFSVCDRLLNNYNNHNDSDLTKIETVQETYLCCSGLSSSSSPVRHVLDAYSFASDVIFALNGIDITDFVDNDRYNSLKLYMSGGVSVGPLLAGVVGGSFPRYCIFGAVVNAAARMMQSAAPGTVRVPTIISESLLNGSIDNDLLNTPKMEVVTVRFKVKETSTVKLKGMGDSSIYVLEHSRGDPVHIRLMGFKTLAPNLDNNFKVSIPDKRPYSAALHSGNLYAEYETVDRQTSSLSPSKFYNIHALCLYPAVRMTHYVTAAAYAVYALLRYSTLTETRIITFIAIVVGHLLAPSVYRIACRGKRRHAIHVAVMLTSLTFILEIISVYNGITRVDDVCEKPEVAIGYFSEVHAAQLTLVMVMYRLPWRLSVIIMSIFAVLDSSIVVMLGCSGTLVVARLLLTLCLGSVAILLAESLQRIDIELYRNQKRRESSLNDVRVLLTRMLPPLVVPDLINNSTSSVAHYAPVTNAPRCTVSPLVHPIGDAQSSSLWQYHNHVVVFQSDMVSFTKAVIAMQSDPVQFFNVIRRLYSMMDEGVELYGLWKMYTVGDAYIAVSGLPLTASASDPVGSALKFTNNITRWLNEINVFCRERGFPEITLRIGLGAGSAVAAIVSEYRPAYLIWGAAPDNAMAMEQSCVPAQVHVHPSVFDSDDTILQLHDEGYKFSVMPAGADGQTLPASVEQLSASSKAGAPVYMVC